MLPLWRSRFMSVRVFCAVAMRARFAFDARGSAGAVRSVRAALGLAARAMAFLLAMIHTTTAPGALSAPTGWPT